MGQIASVHHSTRFKFVDLHLNCVQYSDLEE